MLSTPLGKNAIWALSGYGTRLLIQAAYFVIIARCLGPAQYGTFIAVTAIIGAISPFVGLGCGNLLVKNVARDRSIFQVYWGNGLVMTFVSGAILGGVVAAASKLVLPKAIPLVVILLVGISDLLFDGVQACQPIFKSLPSLSPVSGAFSY